MKHTAVAALELLDAGFAGLPSGRRAEEHTFPELFEQRITVVIPVGIEHAGGAHRLTVAHEGLDVAQCDGVVRIDAIPVIHARRHPRLHADVTERLEAAIKAVE